MTISVISGVVLQEVEEQPLYLDAQGCSIPGLELHQNFVSEGEEQVRVINTCSASDGGGCVFSPCTCCDILLVVYRNFWLRSRMDAGRRLPGDECSILDTNLSTGCVMSPRMRDRGLIKGTIL